MQEQAAKLHRYQLGGRPAARLPGVIDMVITAKVRPAKTNECLTALTPAFFYNLGNSHGALKEWDKIIENYSEALAKDPEHFNTRRNLALTYYSKGDRKAAIECAQELEKLDPNGKFGAWAREAAARMKDD